MTTDSVRFHRCVPEDLLQNEIGDDKFKVQDPLTGNFYIIDFSWKCTLAKRVFGQTLFIHGNASRGYADDENRILVSSLSTARQEILHIKEICEYWERVCPDRSLKSFTRAEIQEMMHSFVLRGEPDGEGILSYKKLKAISALMNRSNLLMLQRKVFDGISHVITHEFKRKIMAPLLERQGIEYSVWKKGGSYGSIPLTCASLMLAEAISIIESDKAKIATVFFTFWRKNKSNPIHWFGIGDKIAFCRKIQANPNVLLSSNEQKWRARANEFGDAIDINTTEKFEKFPWAYFGEFSDFCCEISKACLVIIILLSGFRISEVSEMHFSDFDQDADGSWWFKSENCKTESGFSHPRSLHGLVAKSAEVLRSLSAVDTSVYNLPFFHSGYRSGAFAVALGWGNLSVKNWLIDTKLSKKTLSKWFKVFYEVNVVSLLPEVVSHHKSVSPHQARHTFAEFALRRFDGNILEKLREHFRHSKGSFLTRRYTQNKLNESIRMSMERDFLKEIIGRVAEGNISDRFYGPAALRIEREVARYSFVTEPEFNASREYLDEFQRFVAFEWGYCAIRVNETHSAKCCDYKTGAPHIEQYSSPEVCVGCPHAMYNDLQKNKLERVAIAHQFIAENHPLSVIGDLSAVVVSMVENRISVGVQS
jgi:hypothetical protein